MAVVAIFWLILLLCSIAPLRLIVLSFFASLPFGALTVIPGGPFNLLPTAAMSPLLFVRVFLALPNSVVMWDAVLNWRRLGLLSAFTLVAVTISLTAPVFFSGTPVIGLNTGASAGLVLSAGNLSQCVYLLLGYLVTVSLYCLLQIEDGRRYFARGVLVAAAIALLSGVLDTLAAGSDLLAPLRTATYAVMAETELGGLRRIIGFQSEASAYGSVVVSLAAILWFARPADLAHGLGRYQDVLAVALLLMAAACTSSSAIVGLGIFVTAVAIDWVQRIFRPTDAIATQRLIIELIMVFASVMLISVGLLAIPGLASGLGRALDATLFSKTSSGSYLERMSWNRAALDALSQTMGYGVGAGSSRASSWIVALFAGTGVIGGALMLGFLARCFLAPLPAGDPTLRRLVIGSRLGFVVSITPLAVSGAVIDFGSFNAILFAMMAAGPVLLERSHSRALAARRVAAARLDPRPA